MLTSWPQLITQQQIQEAEVTMATWYSNKDSRGVHQLYVWVWYSTNWKYYRETQQHSAKDETQWKVSLLPNAVRVSIHQRNETSSLLHTESIQYSSMNEKKGLYSTVCLCFRGREQGVLI